MLLASLRELDAENKSLKCCVVELQASNILNKTYCNKLRFQLAGKEAKESNKGKGMGKLMGDGLPRMLSGDEFHARIVKFTEWQRAEELQKAKKIDAKACWKEAVAVWEAEKSEIKAENNKINECNKKAEQKWKAAQTAAKRVKKAFKELKPTKEAKQKLPKKPTLKEIEAELAAEDEGSSSGEDLGDSGV